jgi:hypothetical protein
VSYPIRSIAFLSEILHPPVELQAKTIQELHGELFEDASFSYQNFNLAPEGIHLANQPEQPGQVSSVSFLPDRIQFREELRGLTMEEFGGKVKEIVRRAAARLCFPLVTAQQFVVRSLLNPRHHPDSRAFLAQTLCRLPEPQLAQLQRPMGLFGLKLVFPQTPDGDDSLFAVRVESYSQDPRSIFVENVGTFTHCPIPGELQRLGENLEKTYHFLADRVTAFLESFDRSSGGGEEGG